jgi:hypothetical protein
MCYIGSTMPEKQYTYLLSDVARMAVRHDSVGINILDFSVQLDVLIDGRWRKAVRYDSAHGQPHRHVFYPDHSEYREVMVSNDNNQAYTEARKLVKASFEMIYERYRTHYEGMV